MVFGTFWDLPSPSVMLDPLPLGCCSVSASSMSLLCLASPAQPLTLFLFAVSLSPSPGFCVLCAYWPGCRCLTQMPRDGCALELTFSAHTVAGHPWPLTDWSWSLEVQFPVLHNSGENVHSCVCLWDQAEAGALPQFTPWLGSFPSLLASQSLTESSSLINHGPSNM